MGQRRRRFSERRKAMGLSQESLAEAISVETSTVARWERGETTPQPVHRPRLAEALRVSVEEVGEMLAEAGASPAADALAPTLPVRWPVETGSNELEDLHASSVYEEPDVKRRDALRLATTMLLSPQLTSDSQFGGESAPRGMSPVRAGSARATAPSVLSPPAVGDVARQLTTHGTLQPKEALEYQAVAKAAARVKRSHQAGQHRQVFEELPDLLPLARIAATGELGSEGQRTAADIYQTACSIMLKFGEAGLALLAADRSTAAASQSGDPVAMAASARALAHALASNGHSRRAVATALAAAQHLAEDDARSTPPTVAVRGALLLRASVLAAASEDRAIALTLLAEAQDVAGRLDASDDNVYETYFCALNVQLHKVNVAVRLGDAGQAVEHAQHINPAQIRLGERRASHHLDLAQAFAQWGKHHQAYEALCAAEQAAPQEVAVRPESHELVTELWQRCPPSLQRPLQQLADRIGCQV